MDRIMVLNLYSVNKVNQCG